MISTGWESQPKILIECIRARICSLNQVHRDTAAPLLNKRLSIRTNMSERAHILRIYEYESMLELRLGFGLE